MNCNEWYWIKDLIGIRLFFKFFLIVSNIYKFHMKFKFIGLIIWVNPHKFHFIRKYVFSIKSIKCDLVGLRWYFVIKNNVRNNVFYDDIWFFFKLLYILKNKTNCLKRKKIKRNIWKSFFNFYIFIYFIKRYNIK